jgi:tetratricopeptide (TPR) repeat protein
MDGTLRKLARQRAQTTPEAELLAKAEHYCRRALELDPDCSAAYGYLGEIALKQGRLLEAEALFKRAAAFDPVGEATENIGALYTLMGRYKEAEETLKRCCDLDPTASRARLELANLYLQTDRARDAVAVCRQALAASPDDSEAPRALAVALMQTGEHSEAARVLNAAMRNVDESKRWQLHLTHCQLLTELGDKSDDTELYEEARRESATAIKLRPDEALPYFHAGIVRYKLEDYQGALKAFRACLERDPDHFEAEQNARQMKALIRRERVQTHGGLVVGIVLGVLCFLFLIAIWALYFMSDKVTSTMIATMSPVLLGLVFTAFLLPWLSRLKLPGVEAELTKPKEKLSPGPSGTISFSARGMGAGPRT